MLSFILDASSSIDSTGNRIGAALINELKAQGWDVDHRILQEMKVNNCAGDFFCWIRTPGMCMVNDDSRAIIEAAIESDLLVLLTPVTFGGYASRLKRVVDKLTQINLPFFKEIGGEMHHEPRYSHYPKLLAIGWMDQLDQDEKAIFQTLVQRNAINLHFPGSASGVIDTNEGDETIADHIYTWLMQVQNNSAPLLAKPLLNRLGSQSSQKPIQNALFLVGSPRGKKSTSQALGSYLIEQFTTLNIPTRTVYLYPALNSPEGTRSLLEAIDTHDLTVLASPLYIDCLPGPVIQALEVIAAHREKKFEKHGFMAMINSGFPEPQQSETAVAMCASFARHAGFLWAGSLVLGSGSGIVNGIPLIDLGWRSRSIRKSLELAARSLANGNPVSDEAVKLMAKTRIPKWLLVFIGNIGWKQRSKQFGVETELRKQPYLSI